MADDVTAMGPMDPIRAAAADLSAGAPVDLSGLTITRATVDGRRVVFAGERQRDPIQRDHRAGRFYEREDLDIFFEGVAPGCTFVDIGANVGNHGLYAALMKDAARVVPIEPNPTVARCLLANVALNGLEGRFVLRHLGYGIGAEDAGGFSVHAPAVRNAGAGKLKADGGSVEVRRGDTLFGGLRPDAIKIDVEGMEIDALAGLEETFRRHRPLLMIEVDDDNREAFDAWCDRMGYAPFHRVRRYRANENFMLAPAARPDAGATT
ncbi:MAG: FkbM family methyltransferase [Hasllibacter sp.]